MEVVEGLRVEGQVEPGRETVIATRRWPQLKAHLPIDISLYDSLTEFFLVDSTHKTANSATAG
jgi:hypothetical protein